MFTTLSKQVIPGISFDPSKVTLEETPMGIDSSTAGFTGLQQAGFTDVIKQGDGYRFTRDLPGGAENQYQTRTATLNPDGTLSWKGSWQDKTKESTLEQLRNATALLGGGALGFGALGFGPAAGLLGGGAAGGGAASSGATNAALIESASGTAGYGASSAGLGGAGIAGTGIPQFAQLPGYGNNVATLADASGASPFTSGAASGADPLGSYLTTGASEGSTVGNALTGAGGASGAVGSGTTAGTLGSIANGLGSFLPNNAASWANLGGNLLNSGLGVWGANQASNAQQNSARDANQLARYMYDTTRKDNLPALQARNAGLSGYQNLLQNPGQIVNDPGYKFGFDQGVAGYDNSGSARGMRLSGAQAKALTRFGQDYGQTKFNESLNRYGNLAGLGGAGAGTIANAGQNYANTAGNNITGAGNAAAAGYIGSANAISGGITNYLRSQQESQLLRQLGLGG